jgi:hypothetical protein
MLEPMTDEKPTVSGNRWEPDLGQDQQAPQGDAGDGTGESDT